MWLQPHPTIVILGIGVSVVRDRMAEQRAVLCYADGNDKSSTVHGYCLLDLAAIGCAHYGTCSVGVSSVECYHFLTLWESSVSGSRGQW